MVFNQWSLVFNQVWCKTNKFYGSSEKFQWSKTLCLHFRCPKKLEFNASNAKAANKKESYKKKKLIYALNISEIHRVYRFKKKKKTTKIRVTLWIAVHCETTMFRKSSFNVAILLILVTWKTEIWNQYFFKISNWSMTSKTNNETGEFAHIKVKQWLFSKHERRVILCFAHIRAKQWLFVKHQRKVILCFG